MKVYYFDLEKSRRTLMDRDDIRLSKCYQFLMSNKCA